MTRLILLRSASVQVPSLMREEIKRVIGDVCLGRTEVVKQIEVRLAILGERN